MSDIRHQWWCEAISIIPGQRCNCICDYCGASKENYHAHSVEQCASILRDENKALRKALAEVAYLHKDMTKRTSDTLRAIREIIASTPAGEEAS